MKTSHYDAATGALHYSTGLDNTLAYMLKGFRGWKCYGLVKLKQKVEWWT